MSKDYNLSTNKKIKIASSYRSYIYQKWIIDRGCSPEFCSKPWYSEHQSGLAIDFFEATTENIFLSKSENKLWFDWMNKNAHKYGWHNTYQKWIEVDTYHTEPWHWRYVWEEFATYLLENNLTIAEYYNLKIREWK
jgi:D-alanyl-D-alanine carboxypeptidase